MQCRNCHQVLVPEDLFCGHCGTAVADTPAADAVILTADRRCVSCGFLLEPSDMFCAGCGTSVNNVPSAAIVNESVKTSTGMLGDLPGTGIVIHEVYGSQVAVGNGNTQILINVDGSTQFGHVAAGVSLQVRDIPLLTPAPRRDLVGRDALVEQVSGALARHRSVQLFGSPGVGRTAVAEAAIRRLAAAGTRGVELRPQNEPYSLNGIYRRLVRVFFGQDWYQPEEAVLRLEVSRADLHALIVIMDCDLEHDNLSRLLGSFPGCTFLLTSRRQTLNEDAGSAYEVDPLTENQAWELLTRELGSDLTGAQHLHWAHAYRMAGGQVQRLMEHIAFLKRTATRPGQTDLQPLPLKEQVAVLVAGLTEPARRVLIAMSSFGVTLAPSLFGAVTGIPKADHAAGELLAAGLVKQEGGTFRITEDAAEAVADGGERTDPEVTADGLLPLLQAPDPPDPHLLLAVAKALHAASNDSYTSRLTRAAAPLALAVGEVDVWLALVALGAQAATRSRRKPDVEFFLNEGHTISLLRRETVAAAAALAVLGDLLARQHAHDPAPAHPAIPGRAIQGRRVIGHGRQALPASKGAIAATAVVVATAVGVAVAVAAVLLQSGPSAGQLGGTWTDSAGTVYDFVATGSDTYTASQLQGNPLHCYNADDVKVTGSGGRYKGSIKLYPINEPSCKASTGNGTITIVLAANGDSAHVITAGNDCEDCSTSTWNRKSS